MAKVFKQIDEMFCWCGLPATKLVDLVYLCHKHKAPKDNKPLRGRFSGKSNSPYAYNEY